MDSEMERKMLEQYEEINKRLDSHDETMKSIQISIRKLTEGLKFLITKANKEPSSDDGSYVFNSEGDSVDLSNGESDYEGDNESEGEGSLISPPPAKQVYQTHKVEDQPVPIVALASALANTSHYDHMNQTYVLQPSEPVFKKIEAIKRIWELMEGVKFLVSKTNKEESLSSDDDLNRDDQPMPIIALASALANSSRNQQMDQTDLLQSPDSLNTKVPETVLTNVEAIKRFMRSSRKKPIAVC
ncbi:hypothetical protein L1987_53411 [Smallanthus sonchifolius]|uniref:Uncharacterized protein n=1 Tax=Smallanthus sonchifolius TaxID=185202 RepID=A0ACB9EW88_9ASTR|nr:hypothetical protein L1987_53411 [Smallanthus sonchifolius]